MIIWTDLDSAIKFLLNYAIITFSCILKVPQIVQIVKNKSVDGLVASAFYIDVGLYIVNIAFHYLKGNPFSLYGELVFILVQNIILVYLYWIYTKTTLREMMYVTSSFFLVTIASMLIPLNLHVSENIFFINMYALTYIICT